jgi:hypothetical protein
MDGKSILISPLVALCRLSSFIQSNQEIGNRFSKGTARCNELAALIPP